MKNFVVTLALSAILAPVLSFAQNPIIYPAKGQDTQQTERDKFECYNWAKEQTDFAPCLLQKPQHRLPHKLPVPGVEKVFYEELLLVDWRDPWGVNLERVQQLELRQV